MPRSAPLAVCFGILLATAHARGQSARVVEGTTLRASPAQGAALGEIAVDTPVTEIERKGEWALVRLEGWVPVTALRGTQAPVPPAAAAAAAAAPPPAAPAVAAAGNASLEGTLEIRQAGWLRKKKLSGSGRQVWLVPAGLDLVAAGQVTPEDEATLAQLDADAKRLTQEAERALQGSSFMESTQRHDELLKQRDTLLAKRVDLLTVHHGRREAAARQAALAGAVCDARGFFVFSSIAPGAYQIYARLVDRELDLEWIEAITVGAGGAKIDLDETRADGLP